MQSGGKRGYVDVAEVLDRGVGEEKPVIGHRARRLSGDRTGHDIRTSLAQRYQIRFTAQVEA
jgi:hypothetical protein